jgi:hypothetical protein
LHSAWTHTAPTIIGWSRRSFSIMACANDRCKQCGHGASDLELGCGCKIHVVRHGPAAEKFLWSCTLLRHDEMSYVPQKCRMSLYRHCQTVFRNINSDASFFSRSRGTVTKS